MVDLGVDRGGREVPVTEHLADLGECRPVAQHVGGQRVTQPVRTHTPGFIPARRLAEYTTLLIVWGANAFNGANRVTNTAREGVSGRPSWR